MARQQEVMGRNQTFIVSPPEKALTQVRIHWLLQLVTVNKNQGFDFSLLDQLLDQVTEGGGYQLEFHLSVLCMLTSVNFTVVETWPNPWF